MKPRKTHGNTVGNFDKGKLINKVRMERNLSKTDLGRKMGRAHTTIRTMLKSTSHQAYILYQLSVVLNHNFFADLAHWLPKDIPGREKLDDKRIAELEEQIRELQAENKVLYKLLAAKDAEKG